MYIVVNCRSIIEAGETYFSNIGAFLCPFLPHMRSNYQLLFNEYSDWRMLSADGTKLGVYKEVVNYIDKFNTMVHTSCKNV